MNPQPHPRPLLKRHLTLYVILALALLVRLAHWWAVRGEPFFALLVMDSQEYDRWAREIAAGDWLGSEPFFQAPLYPYFLAVVYAVFGRSLDAAYLIQIALAVAGCYALYRAGVIYGHGDRRLGLAAAALAAIYPVFLFYDVQLLKESPAVALVSGLLWALARARQSERLRPWLLAGLAAGLLALLRENTLLVAPFLMPLARLPRAPAKRVALRVGAFAAGFALVLLPVGSRNKWVGGELLPTTFQGGVNFYIGNNPQADGKYRSLVAGKQVPFYERTVARLEAERALGRELTGREVSRYWLGRALAWARAEPRAFLALQVKKLGMFWSWYEWPDAVDYYWVRGISPVLRALPFGFAGLTILALAGLWQLRRGLGRFAPVLTFIAAWTASTVIFFLFSRYRLPVVPAVMLLAALPLVALAEAWRERRRRVVALAALLAAAAAAQGLTGHEPRMDLVHYNLARAYQEAGRHAEAAEHYRAALAENPEDFLACVNLGAYAARAGRFQEAVSWFERALAIEPRSDDARANLGGVYLSLGAAERARAELEGALELNPRNVSALHNLALARQRQGDLAEARRLNRRVLAIDPEHRQAIALRERLGDEPDEPGVDR